MKSMILRQTIVNMTRFFTGRVKIPTLFAQEIRQGPPPEPPPLEMIILLTCAIVIGVAILSLTVFMAVRIIREKNADKRAEQAVTALKSRENPDQGEWEWENGVWKRTNE